MSIDAIRLFPMIKPSGYPQEYDLIERKMLKQQEMQRASLEQKKTQIAIEDLAFEIYSKNAEQTKLRIEIFQNRKLDIYV
tara:strand:- start:1166 stop:1405 length:240 start_codon:yes stop_codon:yes gene_type:complete